MGLQGFEGLWWVCRGLQGFVVRVSGCCGGFGGILKVVCRR